MQIEQLPNLERDHVSRLRTAGVHSCRQLLCVGRRRERLLALARSTELPPETLQSIVEKAELSQIRGVGPIALAELLQVGVNSLAALAAQEPKRLRRRLVEVAARPPNLAVLEKWILQARRKRRR